MKKYIALIGGTEVYIVHAESRGMAICKVFDYKKTNDLPHMEIFEVGEIEVIKS